MALKSVLVSFLFVKLRQMVYPGAYSQQPSLIDKCPGLSQGHSVNCEQHMLELL